MVEILGCTKKVSLLLLDICVAGTSWAASFMSLFSTLQVNHPGVEFSYSNGDKFFPPPYNLYITLD
jgi:hypothetical protein